MSPSGETRDAPSNDDARPWHVRPVDDVLAELGSDAERGLELEDAARRLIDHGPNVLPDADSRTVLRMFGTQFADVMILVLLAAAAVSGLLGDAADTVAILVIVVLNAVIGTVQEFRAERAVQALRQLAAPVARVMRGGTRRRIPAGDLVPGDVVDLEAGDVVGADLRLQSVADLHVDESSLTGESAPVLKDTDALDEADLPLGDRRAMAYRGTLVTSGRGRGVVVTTGTETELGKIAVLLKGAGVTRTPLQVRLAHFGRMLALAVLGISATIFAVGLLRGEPWMLMLLTAISLAVAAIPEALPAVVTVSLALGARKMARRNALIRRLPAVETLGSVTYVCADKTGTLTQNRMHVDAVVVRGERTGGLPGGAELLARAMALDNDAEPARDGEGATGDPTEVALCEAARDAGFTRSELEEQWPRVGEVAFDSTRKRMATIHRTDDGVIVFVKGAPEVVVPLCADGASEGRGEERFAASAALDAAQGLAAEGYRVLAFAHRRLAEIPATLEADAVERDLTFLGLVGLLDPPREEAASSVALCRSAGITPVMITGDHPGTALAIARRLGIAEAEHDVRTGPELEELGPGELAACVSSTRVYARVSPEQKIAIVRALQARGEFVAMTGDGVNDAPALKSAEIGVAMGRSGTEVAREAADMVLLDDDFSTIVMAIREGRWVFDNIRKFVKYTLTSNSGEIWTLFLAPFLGLPIPLLPIQILWINLVTDGLPGLALAVEPEEPGIMDRPPRPPRESIFAHGMGLHALWLGLLIAALSITGQAWAHASDSGNWQSVVFTVLTFSQLAHALVIRSERESLFRIGLLSNLPLLGAVLLTVALQLAVVYVPALQPLFGTTGLTGTELAVCFGLPLVVVMAGETEKLLMRRGRLYAGAPRRGR